MIEFTQNFLNLDENLSIDYLKLSKKIAALHSSCFNDSQYKLSQQSIFSFLKSNKVHIFYDQLSLAILQVSQLEADLITLVVDPFHQKRGIGSSLLELLILYLKSLKVEKLFLEVATINEPAIKIYTKIGFRPCGQRRNYYSLGHGNQIDASLMVFNIARKNGKLDKKKLQRLYPTG